MGERNMKVLKNFLAFAFLTSLVEEFIKIEDENFMNYLKEKCPPLTWEDISIKRKNVFR